MYLLFKKSKKGSVKFFTAVSQVTLLNLIDFHDHGFWKAVDGKTELEPYLVLHHAPCYDPLPLSQIFQALTSSLQHPHRSRGLGLIFVPTSRYQSYSSHFSIPSHTLWRTQLSNRLTSTSNSNTLQHTHTLIRLALQKTTDSHILSDQISLHKPWKVTHNFSTPHLVTQTPHRKQQTPYWGQKQPMTTPSSLLKIYPLGKYKGLQNGCWQNNIKLWFIIKNFNDLQINFTVEFCNVTWGIWESNSKEFSVR